MTDKERAHALDTHLDAVVERAEDTVAAFLLNHVRTNPKDLVRVTAQALGISRQAVHARLGKLIERGSICPEGTGRRRVYTLGPIGNHVVRLPVDNQLEEDRVWKRFCLPNCDGLPDNVVHLLAYGFTELLNNVRDHSQSEVVTLGFDRTAERVHTTVIDEGIGIFRKIREAFGLENDNQAVLELRKGKLTTDPAHHSGEGIFFSAQMYDGFYMTSGKTRWLTGAHALDFVSEDAKSRNGTQVLMDIAADSPRTTQDVFGEFVDPDSDSGISKAMISLRLLEPEGPGLVSRSQAKRVLARLQDFEVAALDFSGISSVGPAFLDEIFRVFARDHPHVLLLPMHVAPEIRALVERAIRMGIAEGADQLKQTLPLL